MHRSGTSATAGMLHKGGLCLGKDLMEPDWINPAGYFEDAKVIAINSELYHYYKASLWYPPYMEDDEGQFAVIFQQFIDYYKDVDVVAFKNPRFCATFPIWHKYFKQNDIEIKIIRVYRNMDQTAKSLMRVRNIPFVAAYAMTELHNKYLSRIGMQFISLNSHMVFYETLINTPKLEYYNLIKRIGLSDLDPNGYKHIDRSLKHF